MATLTREEAIAIYREKGLSIEKYLLTVIFYENDNEVTTVTDLVYGEDNIIAEYYELLGIIRNGSVKNAEYREYYPDNVEYIYGLAVYLNGIPTKTIITFRHPYKLTLHKAIIIIQHVNY